MAHYHTEPLQTQRLQEVFTFHKITQCKHLVFILKLGYITLMNFSSRPDPKKIGDVLGTGSLSSILKKAKILEAFNHALSRHLPTNLAKHCQVMNFNNSILVVGVDNTSSLTRLRFEEPELIQKFQADKQLPNILGIEYKIFYL